MFIDRDGVINRHRENDYVKSWAEFEFLPKVREALTLLNEGGHRVIIVTNQRGVARKLMTEADLADIHQHLLDEARSTGAEIAAIYYCPHGIGECACRKPQSGLFLEAQQDFPDIEFHRATIIGDSRTDMEAGARLGCRTVLIGDDEDHECAPSLYDAVVRFLS